MIIIKKLTISNFLSHEQTVLEMPATGKLLIDGKSGSGKSTIVEAIIWCLYGIGRVANRQLINRGKLGASVSLELSEVDHFDYRITRTIMAKGRHTIEVYHRAYGSKEPYKIVQETGVRPTQSFIEREITRASYLLFINSIVYPQDNPETFVRQPAAKRKDLLLEIIGNIRLEEYYDRARNLMVSTEKKIIEEKTRNTMLAASREGVLSRLKPKADLEKDLAESKKEAAGLTAQLAEHKKQLDEFLENRNKLVVLQNTIMEKEAKALELRAKIRQRNDEEYSKTEEEVNDLRARKEKLVAKADGMGKWQQDYLVLINQMPTGIDYQAMIGELNRQYIAIERDYSDFKLEDEYKCKNCGTSVKIHEILPRLKQMMAEKNNRLSELEKRLAQVMAEKKDYEARVSALEASIEALGPSPDPVASHATELKIVENNLIERLQKLQELKLGREQSLFYEKELKRMEDSISQMQQLASDLQQLTTGDIDQKYRELELRLNNVNNNIKIASLRLDDVTQAEKELREIEQSLHEIDEKTGLLAEELDLLGIMKEVFSANGLKAMLSDSIIPRFEERINDILSQLSDFRVKLETQRAGAEAGTVLEGLFIDIYNENGEAFDFDSYSGGEKLKIVVAITEALAEIQQTGFRIIDELFIGLDEESVDNFLKVLKTLQQRFPQLLCISHLRQVKESFDTKLTVEKIKNISIIR